MTSSSGQFSTVERRVRLFRNGCSQAVRIPRDFELPGVEVIIHKEGDRLIIEPAPPRTRLLDVLFGLKPIDDCFPDVDDGLQSLDDVNL